MNQMNGAQSFCSGKTLWMWALTFIGEMIRCLHKYLSPVIWTYLCAVRHPKNDYRVCDEMYLGLQWSHLVSVCPLWKPPGS